MSGWLDSAGGFVDGFGDGVWDAGKSTVEGVGDLAKAGYEIATDEAAREQAWKTAKQAAGEAKDYAGAAYDDPAKALKDAKDGANRLYSAFDKARQEAAAQGKSAEFWGSAIGKGAFEVGTMLIPVGAATKLGKLGKGAKAVSKAQSASRVMKTSRHAAGAISTAAKSYPSCPVSVRPCLLKAKKTKKGKRPHPRAYMSKTAIQQHLADFKEGVVRIQRDPPTGKIGPPTGGTFVMSKKDARDVIARAGGNPRKLEKLLGLDPGELGAGPVIVEIKQPKGLRVPSGNEKGANDHWLPGGYTAGGVREAVIDRVPADGYTVKRVFP